MSSLGVVTPVLLFFWKQCKTNTACSNFTKPEFAELRFGFSVTMYVANFYATAKVRKKGVLGTFLLPVSQPHPLADSDSA